MIYDIHVELTIRNIAGVDGKQTALLIKNQLQRLLDDHYKQTIAVIDRVQPRAQEQKREKEAILL